MVVEYTVDFLTFLHHFAGMGPQEAVGAASRDIFQESGFVNLQRTARVFLMKSHGDLRLSFLV